MVSVGDDQDRTEKGGLIAGLLKRVFLCHYIIQEKVFQIRWILNYLAGPITGAQLPLLNQPVQGVIEPPKAKKPEEGGIEAVAVQ